jgi:C-terminal processing protease CtpA/Prc
MRWFLLACVLFSASLSTKALCEPSAQQFSPAELRADFERMYDGLQSAHIDLYAFTPKAELDRAYSQFLAGLSAPMTKSEAEIRFEMFAALVHMGHTRVDAPFATWSKYLESGGKAFPLTLRIVDGKSYVATNESGLADIQPGDEILAINREPMAAWLARTERHVSAETAYMAHSLMEYDFPLYLWLELGTAERVDLTLRRDGVPYSATVPARTKAEMQTFGSAGPQPLNLDTPMRDAKVLEHNVAYLKPGPFYNADAKTGADEWDVSGFRTFIDASFSKFQAANCSRLIIDLRGNPGGDNLFSDAMVAWFADRPFRFFSKFKVRVSPESTSANAERIAHDAEAAGPVSQQYAKLYAGARNGDLVDFEIAPAQPRKEGRFAGKVFVLIDRQSYSNATSVAALVQDYRFGTIIGEETSDMATAHGAMEKFILPNTGIAVGYPKALIVRPNGDERPRGVVPDIAIKIPVVQSPADTVLQEAAAIALRH